MIFCISYFISGTCSTNEPPSLPITPTTPRLVTPRDTCTGQYNKYEKTDLVWCLAHIKKYLMFIKLCPRITLILLELLTGAS